MNFVWIGLVGGAAAFAHCLGMCGGFALHLSQGEGRGSALGRQLLWHGGKTFTYVFLGAVAGFAGGALGDVRLLRHAQDILAYAAGGLMVLMGLVLMGLLPRRTRTGGAEAGEGIVASLYRQFFRAPSWAGAFGLGLATGFLPCPVVFGFLAFSAQTASPATGMIVMAGVGAGTIWSLLLLGMSGRMLHKWLRRWGTLVGGVVLVSLGAVTLLRGTAAFHSLLGCPPPVHESAGAEAPGCCAEQGK